MYRAIHLQFWSDPKVAKLSPNATLIFLYLISNSESNVSGIYNLPFVLIWAQTKISEGQGKECLRELQQLGLVEFDFESQVVWVKNMQKHQARGEKIDRHIANHLKTIHSKRLVADFCQQNGFKVSKDRKGYDIPYRIPYAIGVHKRITTGEQQERNNNRIKTKESNISGELSFAHSPPTVPRELASLDLYAKDATLCREWERFTTSCKQAYPGVDLIGETRKAHAWETANPKLQKKNRTRFLANWFSRAQDGLRKNGVAGQAMPSVDYDEVKKINADLRQRGIIP